MFFFLHFFFRLFSEISLDKKEKKTKWKMLENAAQCLNGQTKKVQSLQPGLNF